MQWPAAVPMGVPMPERSKASSRQRCLRHRSIPMRMVFLMRRTNVRPCPDRHQAAVRRLKGRNSFCARIAAKGRRNHDAPS